MAWKPVKPETLPPVQTATPLPSRDSNLSLRVTDTEEVNAVQDTRLTTAEAEIDALQAADVALDGRVDVLEATDVATDARLDTLEATINDGPAARFELSADLTLPAALGGTTTRVDFDASVLNNDPTLFTNNGTGLVTVARSGVYAITTALVVESPLLSALTRTDIAIRAGGEIVTGMTNEVTLALGNNIRLLNCATIINLTAGQTIETLVTLAGTAGGRGVRLPALFGTTATQVSHLAIHRVSAQNGAAGTVPQVIDVSSTGAALRVTQGGVGNAIEVEDNTTPDGSSFTVDQFGQVGIGTKVPLSSLDISTDGVGQVTVGRHDNTLNPARYQSRKSQGTRAAPVLVGANGLLYEYAFTGYDGAAYRNAALIHAASEGTPAAGSMPGQLRFSTTPTGAVTPIERFRIGASGLIVWGFKAGYGLGAGSGGAVTQLTSKATGVTLNTATGQITMNAAALAANARARFTVTNNLCELNDTIIIHRKNGGTAATYAVEIDGVANGSFVVSVWNYSATARSEAVVLQYSILRGAIS